MEDPWCDETIRKHAFDTENYGTEHPYRNAFLFQPEGKKFDFFANIGLYVLNPNLIKLIPKNKNYDMTDLIQVVKRRKKQIGVYPIDDESWIDVGQWSEYHKAVDRLIWVQHYVQYVWEEDLKV